MGEEKVLTYNIYISLIEQIQFSFVISKSYTQLPAEECFTQEKKQKKKNITKTIHRNRYLPFYSSI